MKSATLYSLLSLGTLCHSKYVAPWQTLPPTPSLPVASWSGTAHVNGIDLWHALFGLPLTKGCTPVVFLHGGFGNSDYFGEQIRALQTLPYSIIAIDTRGHGRSSDNTSQPMTYDTIAEDTIALMDHLEVDKFSVVGWSDGGCTGFNLAMNFTDRIDRVFSFGGTYSYDNVNTTIADNKVFSDYLARAEEEYKELNPHPDQLSTFEERMNGMWSTEPVWTAESFQKIPSLLLDDSAPLMWIVDGANEGAVNRTVFGALERSFCLLLAISFIQDTDTFNGVLKSFLATEK
ncbi:alpha/beta hydrolase fold domain-containing protein [Sarocladium implicatum]|nr:alpha/beta hydrolase fold domain-containing protein [Sarocladium implicatum]